MVTKFHWAINDSPLPNKIDNNTSNILPVTIYFASEKSLGNLTPTCETPTLPFCSSWPNIKDHVIVYNENDNNI